MPKPLNFATSNLFNSSRPGALTPSDQNIAKIHKAFTNDQKYERSTRNRRDLTNSEGENLTVTGDRTLFEDPASIARLKEVSNITNHPGLGNAASKLQ